MNKLEQFLASYRNDTTWGDKTAEEALQSAIDKTWPLRPDYARAELYTRLVEQWDQYVGTGRRIFTNQTINEWEYWYVRFTPVEPGESTLDEEKADA